MKTLFAILWIITLSHAAFGQKVCDNAIDDDGDGLTDLNDSECDCETLIESSLIPNPYFEDTLYSPIGGGMLSCAEEWIQTSIPTTDYRHVCTPWVLPTLSPLPGGGKAYVGFISNTPF